MKKILVIAVAGVLSLVGAKASMISLHGVYGGIKGGVQTLTTKHQTNFGQVGNELGHSGGQVGLFAGYAHMLQDCYLAVEADANMGGYQNSLLVLNSIVKTKTNAIYGIGGLIGYHPITNMVAYIKLGADFAKWDLTSNSSVQNLKATKTQTGLGSGIGIRALIAPNVFLDMAYKYTFFRKIYLPNDSNDIAKPRVQTFTVGFAVKY